MMNIKNLGIVVAMIGIFMQMVVRPWTVTDTAWLGLTLFVVGVLMLYLGDRK